MADMKITPNTGDLGVAVQAAALIVDGPGRTEINDFRGRSKSELVDRYVEIEVVDAPPRGRENEPNVLGVLASVITHGGDQDKPKIDQGRDANGEDGILVFQNGDKLVVQVVSVPVDPTYWRSVSKGSAKARLSLDDAASWLEEAIKKKLVIATADRSSIVLALDIRHCAQLAHGKVIEAFRNNFRDPASYGFAQIWLVGPMTDRCWKIA